MTKIKDIEELFLYLKQTFGDDMNIDIVPSDNTYDLEIIGTYNKFPIKFNYDGSSGGLIISSTHPSFGFMRKLIPQLSIFMDGDGPALEYDVVDLLTEEVRNHTIEWNKYLEERLEVLNSLNQYPLWRRNLSILTETKERRDKRLGFTSFNPSLFPNGSIDDLDKFSEMVDNYSEQDAFLAISLLSGVFDQIWDGTWCDYAPDPFVVSNAINIVLKKVYSMVGEEYSDFANFLDGKNYENWASNWDKYFTYDKKCEYMEAKIKGEDLSKFTYEKPAIKVLSQNASNNRK